MMLKLMSILISVLAVWAVTTAGAFVPRQLDGYTPVRVDDVNVKKMADFAYTSMLTNSLTPVKLIKIAKASKQTASGVNYKLTLELAEEQNVVAADAGAFQCEVIVFDQPRTNTRKIVSTSCTLKRQRRQVPGGYVPRNVNDPDVKEMAAFATNVISASNLGRVQLVQIIRAASQVVAGVNYKMTLLLASKQGGPYGRRRFRCDVTVFDQPWSNTRELTQSQCFRA